MNISTMLNTRKLLLLIIAVTAFDFGVSAQITDLSVTASPSIVCIGNSSNISIPSSQIGYSYSFRNSANTVLSGPTVGDGNGMTFNTGALAATETFNVYAEGYGSSLNFDGVDDYIDLGDVVPYTYPHSFNISASAWVRTTSTQYQYIVSNINTDKGFALYIDNTGKIRMDARQSSLSFAYFSSGPSTTSVNDGLWHYVTGIFSVENGGLAQVYVDGVLESSASNMANLNGSTSLITATNCTVGALGQTTNFFIGDIDDVSLWGRVIPETEIVANMNNCTITNTTNNFALYSFDDGMGTSVNNQAGTINGTLQNMDPATDWTTNYGNANCTLQTFQMTQTPTVMAVANMTGTDTQAECYTYTWIDGNTYTTSNNAATYTIVNGSTGGCDSIVTLDLTIYNQTFNSSETVLICQGSDYTFPDGTTQTNITSPVVYASNLQTVNTGCDSIIETTVNLNVAYNLSETVSVCYGGSYDNLPDGNGYSNIISQLVYTSNLQTVANGCDSIIVTTINVDPTYNSAETATICSGSSYTFPDGTTQNNITTQVVYASNFQTVTFGCDSIIETTVDVNPTYNSAETVSICPGSDYTFPDGTTQSNITAQVVYTNSFQTVTNGCDSIIVTTINVNSTYDLTETVSICPGSDYTFPDGTTQSNITAQVIYTSILQTMTFGCDSIIETTVDVNPAIDITVTTLLPNITANEVGATYRWLDCDDNYSVISGETGQTFTVISNGNYAVEITQNNCTDTSACVAVTTIGISEFHSKNNLLTYPNPANMNITIPTEGQVKSITIFNVSGALVQQETNNSFSIEKLSKGIYIANITTSNGVFYSRFIKE